MRASAVLLLLAILAPRPAPAQDTYEIQVYGSETVAPRATMLELHSNFTFDGQTAAAGGVAASHHALHETVEITHGFTDWFEIGVYFFTTRQPGDGPEYVGSHVRPRVRVPPSWHWPLGVSISQEVGWQRRRFNESPWDWEIRPIVDRQAGRLYWSVNPTFGVSLSGGGVDVAPAATVTYDVSPVVNAGLEYYGGYGTLTAFAPAAQQWQEIFPVVNLNVSPDWEINAGAGIGLTRSTDGFIAKLILGRRFH